jgi:hypothetical protein
MNRKKRGPTVVLALAIGGVLGLVGISPVAVGTYTYEPGGQCADPAIPNQGLTNMGFETGDLTGWRLGRVADDVSVTTADGYSAPNEGQHMVRLGSTYGTPSGDQPPGPNEICQDFVVTEPVESFAYRIFTYDGDFFDHFQYRLTVVNPMTGQIVAQVSGGGWGEEGELKNSGWQQITANLSGLVGSTLRIYFNAGGSWDEALPTWAYLDAASSGDSSGASDLSAKNVSLTAHPRRVAKGKRTTLSARLSPCPQSAGDVVDFFRAGVRIASLPSDGSCIATHRVRVRRSAWFSAESPADQDQLAGVSNNVRVRVKKKT